MMIIEYKDSKSWDQFLIKQKYAQFLESWAWGNLEETEGHKVYRLALADGNHEIKGIFLLIKRPLIGNFSYFYTPRGPILNEEYNNFESWDKIAGKIKELARSNTIVFWRFEPISPLPQNLNLPLKNVAPIQPKNTLILDLIDSEEGILKKMHPKTRYNIRLAEKRGVKINKIHGESKGKEIEIFWELLNKTARRQKFALHGKDHYLNIMRSGLETKLFFAVYQGKNAAANLNINYGDTSVYLHGASSEDFRNVKPAAFLQWEAIKEAKRRGYRWYDFWGINASKCQMSNVKCQKWDCKPEWKGITRFKIGFGGKEVNFPGAYELPINKMAYKLYKLCKNL